MRQIKKGMVKVDAEEAEISKFFMGHGLKMSDPTVHFPKCSSIASFIRLPLPSKCPHLSNSPHPCRDIPGDIMRIIFSDSGKLSRAE